MPLFPEMTTYYKGRTHTQLVVSEGNAPAERYIPSATEGVKFQYEFGPEGNQNVVIPKGKAVTLAGVEWDYETEKHVPALKVANGTTDSVIGVNHHNVYQRRRDRFSGNQPTVITREYIEVPLFTDRDFANEIKFGAAWAAAGNNLDAANAIIGKYIAVDEFGNYTVADGSNYTNVIGQCLGVETDVPPAGYLQYFMEMDDSRWNEFVKQMSYAPSPGRTTDADWNDIGTYPLGTGYLKSKEDLIKNFRAGIPFLTDGYFKARTDKTYVPGNTTAGVDVDVKYAGHVTLTNVPESSLDAGDEYLGVNVTAGDTAQGAAVFVKLPQKFAQDNLQNPLDASNYPEYANGPAPSSVTVNVGGAQWNDFHVDYTNNMVVIYLSGTQTDLVDAKVEINAVVLENQVPGIPTGWDFKGNVGAARILLSHK